jgi:hypothetical protein
MDFKYWIENVKIPDVVYHGPGQEVNSLQSSYSNIHDAGIWFSDNEAIARGYSAVRDDDSPLVLLASIRIEKPFIQHNRDVKITTPFIKNLKSQGYDGVIRVLEYETEFCVFSNDQVSIIGRKKQSYKDFKNAS